MKILLLFFTFLLSFNIGILKASTGFPQLNISSYPGQIFWFLLIFALLYFFISKYTIPKIKTIQNSRERVIKQNITNNSKNISEIAKIQNLIALQLSNAQIESKKNLSKITQELVQIEDKRISELKLENNKIKNNHLQNNLLIEEIFFKNFQNNLQDITQVMLSKLEINLPEQSIIEEIKKTNNIFKSK